MLTQPRAAARIFAVCNLSLQAYKMRTHSVGPARVGGPAAAEDLPSRSKREGKRVRHGSEGHSAVPFEGKARWEYPMPQNCSGSVEEQEGSMK